MAEHCYSEEVTLTVPGFVAETAELGPGAVAEYGPATSPRKLEEPWLVRDATRRRWS